MKIFLLKPAVEEPAVNLKIKRIEVILNQSGDLVVEHCLSKNLYSQIIAEQPHVIFNLASIFEWKKTSFIPAILEIADVPYTGSGFLTLSLSRSPTKLLPLLEKSGVHLPPYKVMPAAQALSTHGLRFPLELCRDGYEQETSLADEQALKNALVQLPQEGELVLREHLPGETFTVFLLDSIILPTSAPPALLAPALTAYHLLEARGLLRLDFVLANEPLLVKINAAPDPLDEDFLKAALSVGWDEQKIIRTLLEHAGRD